MEPALGGYVGLGAMGKSREIGNDRLIVRWSYPAEGVSLQKKRV